MTEFGKQFWEERYGGADRVWSGNPNVQLVAEVGDLPPGTALDAGCGEPPTPSGWPPADGR